jgi:cysteinyl-tRNA synthetase
MSLKYLGPGFDIHAGGNDLVFPHHENEIAQSEAYLDGVFVRYWMHWGSVNLRQEKMSKSVGNFFTAEEILSEFESDVLRLFLLSTAYRSPIEFSRERMQEAQSALRRIRTPCATRGASYLPPQKMLLSPSITTTASPMP